jgi:hypothetical protein
VVDLTTRSIVAQRHEDMNGGSSCAKITKPIYELVKSGKGIMFYAHTPHLLRVPTEINGRFFAKPTGWTPKPKVAPVAPPKPTVRKFFAFGGFRDGTDHVEYDGTRIICVMKDGRRSPSPTWTLALAESYVRDGSIKEIV